MYPQWHAADFGRGKLPVMRKGRKVILNPSNLHDLKKTEPQLRRLMFACERLFSWIVLFVERFPSYRSDAWAFCFPRR